MLEQDRNMPPSREQVEAKLQCLLAGRCRREDVVDWAGQWVTMDTPPDMPAVVWDALVSLFGADLISTDRPYLYGTVDFQHWLEELRNDSE